MGILLLLAGVMTSCGDPTSSARAPSGERQCSAAAGITDREQGYASLAALAAASEAVVVATATSENTVSYLAEDTPETLTRMDVSQTLFGKLRQSELRLRQLGSATVCVDPERTVVVPGRQYVIAVKPFVRKTEDGPTGEYTTVGGPAGLFSIDGTTVRRLDPGSPQLPGELSLPDFIRQLT